MCDTSSVLHLLNMNVIFYYVTKKIVALGWLSSEVRISSTRVYIMFMLHAAVGRMRHDFQLSFPVRKYTAHTPRSLGSPHDMQLIAFGSRNKQNYA